MRLLFVKCVIILFTLSAFSQNAERGNVLDNKGFKHYLGFNAGTLNGVGFSYKYQPGKLGFQLTALPPVGEDHVSSYGFSTHYRFYSAEGINLFVHAGFNTNTIFDGDMKNAGLGMGPEFVKYDIAFSIAINYEVYDLDDAGYPFLGIDLGLFYRF